MKKINKKYLAAAILAGGAAILPLAGSASAETANISLKLAAAATPINFSVEGGDDSALTMTFAANSTTTTNVTPLVVKNSSSAFPIYVSKIMVDSSKAITGYTNQPTSYNYAAAKIDSKMWGAAITKVGSKTISANNDLKTGYTGSKSDDKITAGGSLTYAITGYSSAYSVNQPATKVGELTITVSTDI